MKNGKIVILQVLGGLNLGGAESRVMDLVRHIGDLDITYAFLLHTGSGDYYEQEAKALGCEIYRVPRFKFLNIGSYKRALENFFASHPEIDIVQGHMTSTAAIYLPIAKKYGKITIAHARSAGVDKGLKGWLTNYLRRNLPQKTDYMWACSTEAGKAVYGEDNYSKGLVKVIPNAIDTSEFKIDNCDGNRIEEYKVKYGLNGHYVVGHVGSFRYAKNHEFLLDIFSELLKEKPDAILLLVGAGELMETVKEKVGRLGIADKVVFAGNHGDVNNFYQLMDIVIFPSHYEGLPGTIVETQAAGKKALISENITKDVGVTKLVRYKSLDDSAASWSKEALSYDAESCETQEDAINVLASNGFDVNGQIRMLLNEYKDMLESRA